jgi:predicted nuclease of predicted toxin-antitoxin system
MKFKIICDVHIALKVVRFFEKKGYEAVHVNDILDSYYTTDAAISNYANENGFTVMTKDIDFKNSHLLLGKPNKVLHVTLGNISTNRLIELLENNLDDIVSHFQSEKCFVELGEGYIKVLK